MHGIDSSYAWRRLAASVALSTVGSIGMWCLTVSMPAVQTDLGVSRADISFAYSVNMLGFFAGGVVAGRLVDRRGIVVASIVGALGLAIGFALATATSSLVLFAAAQVLIGFSGAATFAPLVADISHWFEKRRGVAVAIAASGNYLAGAIWPPIIELMIRDHGWRATYALIGAFCLVVMVPLALTLRRRPQDFWVSGCRCTWREGLSCGESAPDEDGYIQHQQIPLSQALEWIDSGKIIDAKSIIAILMYVRHRATGTP